MCDLEDSENSIYERRRDVIRESIKERMGLSRGEIFYVLGNEEISQHRLDLDKLQEIFFEILDELNCKSVFLCQRVMGNVSVRDFRIRQKFDELDFVETRIAVAGNVDTGKTTLLGVLTHNTNDDGRGLARGKLLKHKHEIVTGRTSCVGVNILGFDYDGTSLNKPDRGKLDWQKLCRNSSKIVSLIDLAGHEKYLKTTISGLFGYLPDACMLIVGANAGLIGMTKEHFWLASSLDIPCFFVVTKVDSCPAQRVTETMNSLVSFIRSPFVNRTPVKVKNITYVHRCAEMFPSLRLCPIFVISNVTGTNIDLLKSFIDLIQPLPGVFSPSGPFEAIIHNIFNVPNVGFVISIVITRGSVKINDQIVIGPDYFGKFAETIVKNINRSRLFVKGATHGQLATLFIRRVDIPIRKGMIVTSFPMPADVVPTMEFEASVRVMQHPTTISVGYQAHLHIDGMRQTCKILKIMGGDYLRAGDSATVHFRFIKQPECIKAGSRLVFREGLTRGLGQVTKCYPFVPRVPTVTPVPIVRHKRRNRHK